MRKAEGSSFILAGMHLGRVYPTKLSSKVDVCRQVVSNGGALSYGLWLVRFSYVFVPHFDNLGEHGNGNLG